MERLVSDPLEPISEFVSRQWLTLLEFGLGVIKFLQAKLHNER